MLAPTIRTSRRSALIFLCALTVAIPSLAGEEDPVELAGRTRTLLESSELMIIWGREGDSTFQKALDYLPLAPDDGELLPRARQEEKGDSGLFGRGNMQVVVANLDDRGFEEMVAVWEGPDLSITVFVPDMDEVSLAWDTVNLTQIDGPMLSGSGRPIELACGDFDGDRADEIVVGYINDDSMVELTVLDGNGTRALTEVASVAVEEAPAVLNGRNFALDAGDFDGDRIDEIVLVGYVPDWNGPIEKGTAWGFYAQVFDVTKVGGGAFALDPEARAIVFTQPAYNVTEVTPAVVAGDFDHDTVDDVGVGFALLTGEDNNVDDTIVSMLGVADELSTLVPGGTDHRNLFSINDTPPIDLEAGDLNEDGREELVVGIGRDAVIYEGSDTLEPQFRAARPAGGSGDNDQGYTRSVVAIGNVDGVEGLESDDDPELVTVYNTFNGQDQELVISVHDVDHSDPEEWTLDQKAFYRDEFAENSSPRRHFAFTLGDFDGDRIRVGTPTVTSRREVGKTLVLLNAPPVHFDVLDGTIYDVNECFNENDCDFSATYDLSQMTTIGIEHRQHSTFKLDEEIGGEGNIFGLKVGGKLGATYGIDFSRAETDRQTVTIETTVRATEDDWVYATYADYHLWEYPIFADKEFQGHFAVVQPISSGNVWFASKSPETGADYVPDHEPGNILSYEPHPDLAGNEAVEEFIHGSYDNSFVLDDTDQPVDWLLQFEDFQKNEVSTTIEAGVSGSVSLAVSSLSGSYDVSDISTHTTTVTEQLTLRVSLDAVDLGIGRTQYGITPYTYWSKEGALVIDYAVRPERAPPGEEDTWWDTEYGTTPDPGFVMRWRYDPEKGRPTTDMQRMRTNQIQFSPPTLMPGKTVRIDARVHNFSLAPTSEPVTVRFYRGEPGAGGTLIQGTGGETEVSTKTALDPQSHQSVSLEWLTPQTDDEFFHIWAVIDEADVIDELHDNNNVGWAVLGIDDDLTPVLLESFDAEPHAGYVLVSWRLGARSTHEGVHVWRSHEGGSSAYQRITDSPITDAESLPDRDVVGGEAYLYMLEIFDRDGPAVTFGPVRAVAASTSPRVALAQNAPNPFGPRTVIRFQLPERGHVRLSIFDAGGRLVRTLVDEAREPGVHGVAWDGLTDGSEAVAPGVYFYRLRAEGADERRKMLLLR